MRMIDADKIEYEPMLSARGNGQYEDVMVAYKDQIDMMPTIEERKTGKWINEGAYSDYTNICAWHCSECGEHITAYPTELDPFCRYCGAMMEGKQP